MSKRAPSVISRFIGRAEELANVETLLSAGAQIVLLVGPPGVGNTRPVLRFSAGAAGEHVLVDLTRARSAEELIELVGAALEVPTNRARRRLTNRPGLRVAADGRWFVRAPDRYVDLTRRGALSRILARLVATHRAAPSRALALDDVFEVGWPGERTVADAAATRVYNAIQRLRRLGLERILLTRDDGYLLDPRAAVEIASEPFRSR
jgi:hypothetical protein